MVYESTLEKMTPSELKIYASRVNKYIDSLVYLDRENEEYIKCMNAAMKALIRKHEAKLNSIDRYSEMLGEEEWLDKKYSDSESEDDDEDETDNSDKSV